MGCIHVLIIMDRLRRRILNTSCNQEIGTEDQETTTIDQEPGESHFEPEMWEQDYTTSTQEPRAIDEHRTSDQQPETSNQEPEIGEQLCITCDQESETRMQGPGLRDQEPIACDLELERSGQELRTRNLEHVTCDQEPQTCELKLRVRDQEDVTYDQEPETGNQEAGLKDQNLATSDQRFMTKNRKCGTRDHKHGIRKQNPGPVDVEHHTIDQEECQDSENLNSCLICFGVYDKDRRRPRVLPCGHSLCSCCITNMIICCSITCPSCRAQHEITNTEHVPINYDLEKLILTGVGVSETVGVLQHEYLCGKLRERFMHYLKSKKCIGIFLSIGVIILLYQWSTTVPPTEYAVRAGITKILEHQRQQQMSRSSDQLASFEQTFSYLDIYDKQLETGEKNFRKTVEELEAAVKQCKQLIPQLHKERDWVRKAREEGMKEQELLVSNQECLSKATTAQEVFQAIQDARHQTITAQAWLQHCKEYVYDITMTKALQFLEVMKFSAKLLNIDIVELLKINFADMLLSLQKQVLHELCGTEQLYCEVTLHGGDHHYRHVTLQDNNIYLGPPESHLPPSRAFTLPLAALVMAVLTSESTPVYGMLMKNSNQYFFQVIMQDKNFVLIPENKTAPTQSLTLPLVELVMAMLTLKSTPVYAVMVKGSCLYSAQASFQDDRFMLQSLENQPLPNHAFVLSLGDLLEVVLIVGSTPVYVEVTKDSHQYSSQVLFQDNKFIVHPLQNQPLPSHAFTLKLADLMMAMLTRNVMPVYVMLTKDSLQYSSQLLLQDGNVILHSLQEQPVPDHTLIVPYDNVRMLIDDASALTFLDLAWKDTLEGRVYIQLTGSSGRGQLFLALCTGEQGPSYRKTLLHMVNEKGYTGEEIVGGDYENRGGGGGSILPGLKTGGEQDRLGEVGLVYGVYEKSALSAQFAIVTRPYLSKRYHLSFGKVVKGIELVTAAIKFEAYYHIIVDECGVILPLVPLSNCPHKSSS